MIGAHLFQAAVDAAEHLHGTVNADVNSEVQSCSFRCQISFRASTPCLMHCKAGMCSDQPIHT
jgi:hypothetical protein